MEGRGWNRSCQFWIMVTYMASWEGLAAMLYPFERTISGYAFSLSLDNQAGSLHVSDTKPYFAGHRPLQFHVAVPSVEGVLRCTFSHMIWWLRLILVPACQSMGTRRKARNGSAVILWEALRLGNALFLDRLPWTLLSEHEIKLSYSHRIAIFRWCFLSSCVSSPVSTEVSHNHSEGRKIDILPLPLMK